MHGQGHGPDHDATHGAHAIAYSFGFYVWYGCATCAAMVVFAKLLGFAIKRPDTYYGQPEKPHQPPDGPQRTGNA